MLKAKSANDTRVRGWCVYSKEVTWVSVLHRRSDGSLQGSHLAGRTTSKEKRPSWWKHWWWVTCLLSRWFMQSLALTWCSCLHQVFLQETAHRLYREQAASVEQRVGSWCGPYRQCRLHDHRQGSWRARPMCAEVEIKTNVNQTLKLLQSKWCDFIDWRVGETCVVYVLRKLAKPTVVCENSLFLWIFGKRCSF